MTDRIGMGVQWDLTSFFPTFNGTEMLSFKAKVIDDIHLLLKAAESLKELQKDNFADWESIVLQYEDVSSRLSHIYGYVECCASCDATNEEYLKEEAALSRLQADMTKVEVEIVRALRAVSDSDFDSFIARPALDGAQYQLKRFRYRATHSMSPEMERLTSDILVDGFHSWMRLYDTLTGKLEFEMKYPDGRVEKKPISQWRAMISDENRELGKAAFECGNKAWSTIEDTAAAILNSISGVRLTLNKYRGIEHFLDVPLFSCGMSRATLDALFKAIYDNAEVAREIYRIKSAAMGRNGIYFYEREAPIPISADMKLSWEKGRDMVKESFGCVYPKFAQHYEMMLEKRWIESQQRPGKRPGAFCSGSDYNGEQRVYMTFSGTLHDASTIAHEVGHAFHNQMVNDLRLLSKRYPATLSETASTFGELLFSEGMFNDPNISDEQKLAALDGDLTGTAILLLDIPVRFEFERKYHEERMKGELTVTRFKELMVETQREIFGDALIEGGEDPYFWVSKLHFYLTYITFYNYPYVFGFLLARQLFNRFQKEGKAFLPQYEEFLRLTGQDTVENVVKRSLGSDITDPAFWAEAIHTYEAPIEKYRQLLAKRR